MPPSKKKLIISLIALIGFVLVWSVFKLKKPKEYGLKIKTDTLNNCQNVPDLPTKSKKLVTKIIDGDTFLIQGGYSVRILGIDADERGEKCYQPAKDYLRNLILNKEVLLEKGEKDKDKWCRYLRYVFLGKTNISLEMVNSGMAVARFSGKYDKEISLAEELAKSNGIGCKWEKKISRDYSWQKILAEGSIKLIDACQAKKYIGEKVIIEGIVAEIFYSQKGNIFLNFVKPYPNQCFTAVIFKKDKEKLEKSIKNAYYKKVRILGTIKEYKGKPEVVLTNKSQIEIGK